MRGMSSRLMPAPRRRSSRASAQRAVPMIRSAELAQCRAPDPEQAGKIRVGVDEAAVHDRACGVELQDGGRVALEHLGSRGRVGEQLRPGVRGERVGSVDERDDAHPGVGDAARQFIPHGVAERAVGVQHGHETGVLARMWTDRRRRLPADDGGIARKADLACRLQHAHPRVHGDEGHQRERRDEQRQQRHSQLNRHASALPAGVERCERGEHLVVGQVQAGAAGFRAVQDEVQSGALTREHVPPLVSGAGDERRSRVVQ